MFEQVCRPFRARENIGHRPQGSALGYHSVPLQGGPKFAPPSYHQRPFDSICIIRERVGVRVLHYARYGYETPH